jgi:hypothetical protein
MDNNEDVLAEINLFCRSDSLLIINSTGKLQRLYCPFKVIVIRDVNLLKAKDTVDVIAVKISQDLILLYVVRHRAYPYYLFRIPDQKGL